MSVIKDFFKAQINWKSYNNLIERLTKYEDAGHHVRLSICILYGPYTMNGNCYQAYYLPIYNEKTELDIFTEGYANDVDLKIEELKEYFYEHGLFYKLGIYNSVNEYEHISNEEKIIELYRNIHERYAMDFEYYDHNNEIILSDK